MRNFGYYIREGFHGFASNLSMSLACITIVTFCLIVFGMYLIVGINTNNMADYARSTGRIGFFISRETDDKRVQEIGKEIEKLSNVAKVEFIGRNEGLSKFSTDITSGFDAENNPLPDSYWVTFKDLKQVTDSVGSIMQIPELYKNTDEDFVKKIEQVSTVLQWVAIVLMGIMVMISIFIISNTIKMTVFNRRKDINIMKYIGATNWFVRWPFIVEGIIIGLIGGLIALGVIAFCYEWGTDALNRMFVNMNVFDMVVVPLHSIVYTLIGAFLGFGAVIGGIGSAVSVRRHLHV